MIPEEDQGEEKFVAVGDAQVHNDDDNVRFALTPGLTTRVQKGAVWCKEQVQTHKSWQILFDAYFGSTEDGGNNGIAFVIQNDRRGTTAIGGTAGHFLGYGGRKGDAASLLEQITPSLAIEFDTSTSFPTNIEDHHEEEHHRNHVTVWKNGDMYIPLGRTPVDIVDEGSSDHLDDGQWHYISISYDASNAKLHITVNVSPSNKRSVVIDIGETIASITNNDWAYWGFTSSTYLHDIKPSPLNNKHEISLFQNLHYGLIDYPDDFAMLDYDNFPWWGEVP